MKDGWENIALAIIGGGGVTGVLTALLTKRKHSAEGRSLEVKGELQIVSAATEVVEMLKEDLKDIRKRLDELERENRELKKKVGVLKIENKRLSERCENLEKENERLRGNP